MDIVSNVAINIAISTLIIPLVKNDYVLNYIQLLPAVLLYLKKFKYQN